MRERVTLHELAVAVGGAVVGDRSVVVADVHHDSRQAAPGTMFVAVRGFDRDGHEFVPAAEAAGVAAVCVERPQPDTGVPQLVVADTRSALAHLAAEVHGHPSRLLAVLGVTGTNGKTTVTHLIEEIISAAGLQSGLIGTLGARVDGHPVPMARTTPEASDLQRVMRAMVDAGVEVAALEVSSHALSLHRVDATSFRVAAFTNLSRDHLDFHEDFESYFAAKARLFEPGRAEHAVIWEDDPWAVRLRRERLAESQVTTVGMTAASAVHPKNVSGSLSGSCFRLVAPSGTADVELGLAGEFNVANALVAAACCLAIGVEIGTVAKGLSGVSSVPGRFERVGTGGPEVIVDYAHTPASVAAVVAAARALTLGKLIAVVGAGGDRDRDKRPEMGTAAAGADLVVVTSDNPRGEEPARIAAAVAGGARAAGGGEVVEVLDRARAIETAVSGAAEGDVVLILGKGAEQGQEIDGRVLPFDDREVARAALEDR